MNKNGGLEAYINLADQRAKALYEYIDNSDGFYVNSVDPKYRSKINVPFRILDGSESDLSKASKLEEDFLELAQ
jgi:phosphoserine aminotransferase